MTPALPKMLNSLEEISEGYRLLLCDVWGVLHNGIDAFADSAAALEKARGAGKAVVLITNAPRRAGEVEASLSMIGVPRQAWDRLVTSGDVTCDLIAEGPRRVFYLGPDRDMTIFDGLDVECVEEFEADAVVCTGLVDDDAETPADYADMLLRFRSRDLPFICANPDIVVERGEKLVWCAGALARDYAQLGGRTLIAGKPHRPIYEAALEAGAQILGGPVTASETLAVGDGILTDIKGAVANGIDAVFVTAGIHAADYADGSGISAERLAAFLERHGMTPLATMPRLR